MKKILVKGLLSAALLWGTWGIVHPALAQGYGSKPAAPSPVKTQGANPDVIFQAELVNATVKASQKSATVQVKVSGVSLVDPDTTDGKPHAGQAHLHYQLDGGPVVATTATKLSFHGLAPGSHKIVVSLAENDHSPAGKESTLTVNVP